MNQELLKDKIEEQSKYLIQYHNNLDELLDIETKEVGAQWDRGVINENALYFKKKTLEISKYYNWYITDKSENYNVFKVVGLHKDRTSKDVVYLLGNIKNKTFLIQIENKYLIKKINYDALCGDEFANPLMRLVIGTTFAVIGVILLPSIISSVDTIAGNKR